MTRTAAAALCSAWAAFAAPAGKRPYELDWANRTEDDRPPLVDFEDLSGWRVETENAAAEFVRSQERPIWGSYVGKLTYRADGGNPVVRVLPPDPVPVLPGIDAVTLWIDGNNVFGRDKTTPPVTVSVDFADANGKPFHVALKSVSWKGWFLCHKRLTPEMMSRVDRGGTFTGFTVTRGRNTKDRVLFFDNLAVFQETFPRLTFEPRPERGVSVFSGRDTGANSGPGRLPFPTRPETIVPTGGTGDATVSVAKRADVAVFTSEGSAGTFVAEVPLDTCMWDGVRVRWEGRGDWIRPCVGGGAFFVGPDGEPVLPEDVKLRNAEYRGKTVACEWDVVVGRGQAAVKTRYWVSGTSLVIDLEVPCASSVELREMGEQIVEQRGPREGVVAEVRFGRAGGFESPRLVTIPYYTYGQSTRPACVVSGPPEAPLFFMGHIDWTLSNASTPWAENKLEARGVAYNGGTRYTPKTDGRRNACYERFVLTLSPRFEGVLPTIPNPTSPWKHVTGSRVWRAHGASDRERDTALWRSIHRYGMTDIVVTDHETGWRDDHESFTFRTRPAPRKGGDEGQRAYARVMQDELGFVYGPYNNFTDFAPVNEFWHIDMVARRPDNSLQTAWYRCYAPKPARAVEYGAKLPPILERKFDFSTAYCDVHTAVTPWSRTDYDYRVPGAGTFGAVFYAYGEIMLLQKQAWGGPVYSEGNNHFPYCGLTDGNYAQDYRYGFLRKPWLVDFDLLKMHDLCCNFGMGNLGMFYGRNTSMGNTPEEVDRSIDRFLAATVAFGHTGFLVFQGGRHNTLRSYYMLQQLHSRYALGRAEEIRYVATDGRLLDTSTALASGAYKRSQVVTRYSNGCVTAVNGNQEEWLRARVHDRTVALPPNGYSGWTEDGDVYVFSGESRGRRADYADTPVYIYVDGRGRFVRFDRGASTGPAVCRILSGSRYEVIPYKEARCGFAVDVVSAQALDEARESLGPAELRRARGLTYVLPVDGAFSYLLQGGEPDQGTVLKCDREHVIPGETVTVRGAETHTFGVPVDAKPGERLWREFANAWIDFTVVPLCEIGFDVAEDRLVASLRPNLDRDATAAVALGSERESVRLEPGRPVIVSFDLGQPGRERARRAEVSIEAGGMRQTEPLVLLAVRGRDAVADPLGDYETGMCLRGGPETSIAEGYGGGVYVQSMACGGVPRKAIRMHPPYKKGVGYTFALFEPVALPPSAPSALRAWVGKGDGSDLGDGILYRVVVIDEAGDETQAGRQKVEDHRWLPMEADLGRWAGKSVRLKLVTDVGEADSSTGDWGCWADFRVEERDERCRWVLGTAANGGTLRAGPSPVAGLTLARLRSARRGRLHYSGAGLEGEGTAYETRAVLNGLDLVPLKRAGGNPAIGLWAEDVTIPLTVDAIAALGFRNELRIKNPAEDCFKLRDIWLELELADGTACSSAISADVRTQPPSWLYAEGAGVPQGRDITIQLWFE